MGYSLSEEEKIVLSELQKDLIKLNKSLISWGVYVLNYLYRTTSFFILSLEEFKLKNIQKKGLCEILYHRALKFFKLEDSTKKEKAFNKRGGINKGFEKKKTFFKLISAFKIVAVLVFKRTIKRNKKKNIAKNVYIDKYS